MAASISLVAVSKRRDAAAGVGAPAPAARVLPMRPLPAVLLSALLVVVAVAAGVTVDRFLHPAPTGAFASCRPQTATAPGRYAGPPPKCIDPAANYQATLVTTKGSVTMQLLPKESPQTVNNFVVLAVNHYYDGLRFWRVDSWVALAGDPDNNGRGGPGYTLPPEPRAAGSKWAPGDFGMARYPDSRVSGSQFFVLRTAWQGGDPSAPYNHFATVTLGFDVLGQVGTSDRILQVSVRKA